MVSPWIRGEEVLQQRFRNPEWFYFQMLILIISVVNTRKPQGSYVSLFTINLLNLEETFGEAAERIRSLVDEA